jgi:hypothetical protein
MMSSTDWVSRLKADYPQFVTRYPECGDGWEQPIRGFFDDLISLGVQASQFHLGQIKEKYASLTIYYTLSDDVSEEQRSGVLDAYDTARKKAAKTCEITGEDGYTVDRGGWYMVRSPKEMKLGDKLIDDWLSIPSEPLEAIRAAITSKTTD